MNFDRKALTISIQLNNTIIKKVQLMILANKTKILLLILLAVSVGSFIFYTSNQLAISYNDARSHLDIARRVVENIKPGFAQLGSVWLPLPHLLMTLTIWNDFMWHSGLAGAIFSMGSFIATGIIIYLFLRLLQVGIAGRLTGVLIFILNINILYMQSTAMTELLLLATMTAGAYKLTKWHISEKLFDLIQAAFWIMLSTLIRYDGWFLFFFALGLVLFRSYRKYGYKAAEGAVIVFATLGGFGILLWFFWNFMIFKDPLYFIYGPYSANAQQLLLEKAGALPTKHDLQLSLLTYYYAIVYNSSMFIVILSILGGAMFWLNKKIAISLRIAALVLLAPLFFNVIALFLGHSALYVQNLNSSWFNVRYGLMMVPTVAIFTGYLIHRIKPLRMVLIGLILFVSFFVFVNRDAVTIDDAVFGASGKNVTEVSGWLRQNATGKDGFILISVASHDAIVFSSGLPMSKYIHEGTGVYWKEATEKPEKWVRWIIVRSNDNGDQTWRFLAGNPSLNKYKLVNHFPFADIYELKPEFISRLEPLPVLPNK